MIGTNTVSLNGTTLKANVDSLKSISKNAISDEDRVVNFFIDGNELTLTASDSARTIQSKLAITSEMYQKFAIPSEKLHAVLNGDKYCLLRLTDSFVEYLKHDAEVSLPRKEVTIEPFNFDSYEDKLEIGDFLQKLRNLSKHLSKENTDTSVVLISEGKMYVRSTLYHGLTDINTKGTYVLDKFTITNLISMCVAGRRQGADHVELGSNDNSCFARVGSIEMNFAKVFQGASIDFSQLEKINNFSGFIANRDKLVKYLDEIKVVTELDKIDLLGVDTRIILRPAIEGNTTNYTIECKPVVIEGNILNFNHTLSNSAITSVLRSLDSKYVLIATTVNKHSLTVATVSEDVAIQYYIMVI